MLAPQVGLHFPERFHFIVAVMEQGSPWKCGHRLTELDEHAFLLGLLVDPKEIVGFVFVAYDQHSNEIIEAASRYTFNVKVYGRFSTRQLGRTMDIDFVFPECLSLEGKWRGFAGFLALLGVLRGRNV